MRSDRPDVRLALVIRRQHGTFSRPQALHLDFTDAMILHRLRIGLWITMHAGVYADSAVPHTSEQDAMAATLACGEDAVASHRTAARLLRVDVSCGPKPAVTVPWTRHPRHPGIGVHRSRTITRGETTRVDGIPTTSGMRTLVDICPLLRPAAREIALDTLWRGGFVHPERLLQYLDARQRRSRAGTGMLRALARERIDQRPPGSDLETIYIQILKSYSVPLPVRQYPVITRGGRRFIDLAYPEHRIAVELDGFERHGRDRSVFDDDHVRRNDLDALGWNIREFTRTHCLQDPPYVALTTAEAIGLVPVRWKALRSSHP